MKRFIIVIALALSTLTLPAKELTKNHTTGMALCEDLGVYSITGDHGVIILGTKDQAQIFFKAAHRAIVKEVLNDIFSCGKDQFEVGKDDRGYYIIKVGLGGVKLRYSDIADFGGYLGLTNLEKPAKKLWSKAQNAASKLIDQL